MERRRSPGRSGLRPWITSPRELLVHRRITTRSCIVVASCSLISCATLFFVGSPSTGPGARLGLGVGAAVPAGASTPRRPSAPPLDDVAWVTNDASLTDPGNAITPVDLVSHEAEAKVRVGSLREAASLPSALAFTKDDKDLLVVTRGEDKLTEVDPSTHRVERSVTVGLEPDAVAVAPGGPDNKGIALVANLGDNTVTPVDLATWKAGTPIPVGTQPIAIAVAAGTATAAVTGNATAFVADFGSDQVTPINLTTLQAGAPLAVGASPETLAMAGGELLVGNFGNDTVTPIDITTLSAGAAVALPINPTDIVATMTGTGTGTGTTAYVSGGASVLPLTTTVTGVAVGAPIALHGVAQALALTQGDKTAWVALQGGSIVEVSLTSGTVERDIHVGGHPSALLIAAD
jgi:YVTN family beta-propeller protein